MSETPSEDMEPSSSIIIPPPSPPLLPPLEPKPPKEAREEKKEEKKKAKDPKRKRPVPISKPRTISYPYHAPVRRSSATTIPRAVHRLVGHHPGHRNSTCPACPSAVAIGPYQNHRGLDYHDEMEDAKRAAVEEFCRVAGQPREAVLGNTVLPLAGSARGCYEEDHFKFKFRGHDDELAEMMLLDGCFLLQFMVSMCPADPEAQPEADPLMSRPVVHGNIDAIARDVLLLENQIPWPVLQALMDLRPGVPVHRFLDLMASAFDISSTTNPSSASAGVVSTSHEPEQPPPPHLFGLFHRRQVGAARTQSHRVPVLSSLGCTAVELADMGVKLTASKTKKFGDMSMAKRRPGLAVFAELSLAPFVLNDLTACWLLNMVAYETSMSATQADNFAVSSYVTLIALLINREADVQELRAKGIINSTMSDEDTLGFFKSAARNLRIGHRYYDVFRCLHEYKKERWMWIAIHGFFYRNIKTIVAVLSAIGVLVGLFKAILSLKQPKR